MNTRGGDGRLALVATALLAAAACHAGPSGQIGPGPDPSGWPATEQTKLGWKFNNPTDPADANFFPNWDKTPSGTPTAWKYSPGTQNGTDAQWWINTLDTPQSSAEDMPYVDTYLWFSFVYDYNKEWTGPGSTHKRPHTIFSQITFNQKDPNDQGQHYTHTYAEQYYKADGTLFDGDPGALGDDVAYSCFTQVIILSNAATDSITLKLGTDRYYNNGYINQGEIWQPYVRILGARQRLPVPTFEANVVDSQGQQHWVRTQGGTYTGVLEIAVSCSNFNATFHYTTDGSEPSDSSPQPVDEDGRKIITLEADAQLKVRASLSGYAYSEAQADFTLVVPPPEFAPESGTFFDSTTVAILCRDRNNQPFASVNLYYTDDGSDPTTASTSITNGQPVPVTKNGTVLKALATRTDWHSSESRSASYILMVSNVVLHPDTGYFADGTNIQATCATPGAAIHYEVGSAPPTPTVNSPTALDGMIPVSGSVIVKAKGFKTDFADGPEAVGYYIAGATRTHLATLITPPPDAQADAQHPPTLYSRGDGGGYVTNIVIDPTGHTNYYVTWTNYVTRGIYLSYTNVVVAMNAGELEIDWWDGTSTNGTIRSLYVILDGPAPGTRAKKLYWNQPPSRGPLVDVTAVPKLTFFYNENIPAPTNAVHPETVWVQSSGVKQHLNARSGIGYLVLLYEGAVTNGPLMGVDVVQVTPDIGWRESHVPVGSRLQPFESVTNAGDPFVSAGTTENLLYQNVVDGKMYGAVFAVEENDISALTEVFWQENAGYGFNVNWPYEMHRYTAYWPEENDAVQPARVFVRGDSDDDLGAQIYIPGDFNPELMEAEDYAGEFDHGFLTTNYFMSTGPGKSLLKLATDNGNGQAGSEWVGFEVIKSVARSDLLWDYRREIRLTPATPVDSYQLRLVLSSDFSYAHCQADGDDLRFYAANGAELDYWIEAWHTGAVSVIWVRIPDAGTDTLVIEYGNAYAYALSDAADTFDFYDDFATDLELWDTAGSPSLSNGVLTLEEGDQLVAQYALESGRVIEARLATALTAKDGLRGSFCGVTSASAADQTFLADQTLFTSNPVNYADWDFGRNGQTRLAGQCADGKYVSYGPALTTIPADTWVGVALEHGRVVWLTGAVELASTTQHLPGGTLHPLLNMESVNGGASEKLHLSDLRVRAWTSTPPAVVFGPETAARTLEWAIGTEITDDHQEGPGSGYIFVSQGDRYLPTLYGYPSLTSQIYAVNTGTVEVWWSTWILSNRVAAGIQIPSYVRRYDNVWPDLHTNYALVFDGNDDSVFLGTPARLDFAHEFTLEAWIKPAAQDNMGAIIARKPGGYDHNGYTLYVNEWNTTNRALVLETHAAEIRTAPGVITLDEWQHVAASVSGTNAVLYVNGVPQSVTGEVSPSLAPATPVALGVLSSGSHFFKGMIDEVRFWNTALTSDEIIRNMRQELRAPHAYESLVAYYRCNEAGGLDLADDSQYAHAGEVVGATWSSPAAPITAVEGNVGQIVVASGQGGLPLGSTWKNLRMYSQNDPGQPGYNPNEEHAIVQSGRPYALRNDLNRRNSTSAWTSEPFVLMTYQVGDDAANRGMQLYAVLATNAHYDFVVEGNVVARKISPIDPMAEWPGTDETLIFQGPGWKDRNDGLWAAAAGNSSPYQGAWIVVGWYYPWIDPSWFVPDWYDYTRTYVVTNYIHQNNNFTNVVITNITTVTSSSNSIPLLDRFAGTPAQPVRMWYDVRWESNYPALHVCDTLSRAKNGLPDVMDQTSARILYQQGQASSNFGGGPAVQLIDPTRTRSAPLPSDYSLPPNVLERTSDIEGHYYFNDLPPDLNRRLWYDPIEQALLFKGEYVTLTSSQIGQDGYLLLNVIQPRQRDTITNVFAAYDDQDLSAAALALCVTCSVTVVVTNDAVPFDTLALSAGAAQGTGYVTLAFNTSTNIQMQPPGDPVTLAVINVIPPLFSGELEQPGMDDNPFDQETTVRETCDYEGAPQNFIFDWRYVDPDPNGLIPADRTNIATWNRYPGVVPASGQGADSVTIPGDDLFALDSHYFACRYKRVDTRYPGGTNWSEWTPAAYIEGWIQRTLDAINPFEQRYYSFYDKDINTLVSMIAQSGKRWTGDVPLDPATVEQWGLIEIYMTILRTAMNMSINADPPHHDANANHLIMLVAGRLARLYTLLGNEAYADAHDPTIGFGTEHGVYGHEASTIHCFMNQTVNLLDETLILLRGRGSGSPVYTPSPALEPPVWTSPYYNKLPWNFTGDPTGGEVAYTLTYGIKDELGNADGIVDEKDAAIQYPQGHGDAWGHYLTALSMYSMLVHNPFFDWIPGTYVEDVGDVPVAVSYYHEQTFAEIAAAKARVGAETVHKTYRNIFSETGTNAVTSLYDSDTNRAWGVSEWGARAGMGAYFDWLVANAVLPAYSPETGIQKIDRTNVTELSLIADALAQVQQTVDSADRSYSPLGVARQALPFDLDPSLVYSPEWVPYSSKSHFEQIYDRAVMALRNARTAFDYARDATSQLRLQADTVNEFRKAVRDQELDYKFRLIELYGYPYPDDVGPGGTYASGYDGPDLFHWMYLDDTYFANQPQGVTRTTIATSYYYTVDHDGDLHRSSVTVSYTIDGDSQMVVKPGWWTSPRPAQGEIQRAYADVLRLQGAMQAKLTEFDNQIAYLEELGDDAHDKYGLYVDDVVLFSNKYTEVATMNSLILVAKGLRGVFEAAIEGDKTVKEVVKFGVPWMFVAGLAAGTDPSFLVRETATAASDATKVIYSILSFAQGVLVTAQEFAKELIDIHVELKLRDNEKQREIREMQTDLRNAARQIGITTLELFELEASLNQAFNDFLDRLQAGYRLQDWRVRFRQKTAAQTEDYRYKDMGFRIFRNDALQKYRAQFDLAAMYAYLAAKAYDYETALQPGDSRGAGVTYLDQIVKTMAIGNVDDDGDPVTGPLHGDPGLADPLARMKLNWDYVLKGQLGFNSPEVETSRFSLRSELFRCLPDNAAGGVGPLANRASLTGLHWRTVLEKSVVSNIFDLPDVNRFCVPFAPRDDVEPGIVIYFGTTIEQGKNYFGWDLAGGDNAYDSSHYATKIRSVGVWFENYDTVNLAAEPRVYLFPYGVDTLRSPGGDGTLTRSWTVFDQVLPVPFPVTSTDLAQEDWIPLNDSFGEPFGALRRFPAIRAYNDSGEYEPDEALYSTRLIGRSVWNSDWMLVIPGSTLHNDSNYGLEKFLDGVTDIKIFFETYSYSGN